MTAEGSQNMTGHGSCFRRPTQDDFFILLTEPFAMPSAVKRTISLPEDLARETEERARAEGKSFSAVVQEALRIARAQRGRSELRELQAFWSRKARDAGIVSEDDLDRYLAE